MKPRNFQRSAKVLLCYLAVCVGSLAGLGAGGCAAGTVNAAYGTAVQRRLAVCEAKEALRALTNPATIETVRAAIKKDGWEAHLQELGLSVGFGQLSCILHSLAVPALEGTPGPEVTKVTSAPSSEEAHRLTDAPGDCPDPQSAMVRAYPPGCNQALRAIRYLAEHRVVPSPAAPPAPSLPPAVPAPSAPPAAPPAAPSVPVAPATPSAPSAPSAPPVPAPL